MSEKDIQVHAGEIRDDLVKALKESVEKHEKNIEALSKKEKAVELEIVKKVSTTLSDKIMKKLKSEYGDLKKSMGAMGMQANANMEGMGAPETGGMMAMGEKGMKKNATQGYGAGEGGGFPGLQPKGQGMNKAELCKACGKTHEIKKCDMDKVKPEVVKGEGVAGYPLKGTNKKSEDFINLKTASIPGKRLKEKFKNGTTPDDKKSKKVEAEGSGGQITKGKSMKKSEKLAKAVEAGGASYTAPIAYKRANPIKLPGVKTKATIPGKNPGGIATAPTMLDAAATKPDIATEVGGTRVFGSPRKQGADEWLAAHGPAKVPGAAPLAAPAPTIPGVSNANDLAADKKAGGVGFINALVTKLKGTGNKTWDATGATGAAKGKHRMGMAVSALARSEMKKADKPAVGRPETPSEKAFGNKTAMTAEATAGKPGEPAKSMYKAEVPGKKGSKFGSYTPHMAWMTDTADHENGADLLAHKTASTLLSGGKASPHAVAHTLGWLNDWHGSTQRPEEQKTIKELHGAVQRLGNVKAPVGNTPKPAGNEPAPKLAPLKPQPK